ncbi:hypothetical protein EDB19DRAFT_1834859 [Suillus lakei]|nr:hypothetical protein EDB19DRAFT_1834859 [Suillus lakei]
MPSRSKLPFLSSPTTAPSAISQHFLKLFKFFLFSSISCFSFCFGYTVVLYRFSLWDPLDRGPWTAFGPFLDRFWTVFWTVLWSSKDCELPSYPSGYFSGSFWLFLALSYVEFQGISSSWNLLVLLQSPSAIFVWNFGTPPHLLPLLSGHRLLHVRLRNQRNLGSPPARRHPNAPAVQPLPQNAPHMNIPQMLGNLNHGPIPMQRFPGLPRNVVEHHEAQPLAPPFGHIPAPAPAALQNDHNE